MESQVSCFEDSFMDKFELDDNFFESKSIYSITKKPGKWTQEEDDHLKRLVDHYGSKNWKKISTNLSNKTPVQCLHRWSKILKPGLTKGPWSIEEDRKLLEWVRIEGAMKWSQCAEYIKGRSGKQCRERWFNTLHPDVKKGGWSSEEDYIIFQSFSKFGSKWSKIANELPGRTENSIKNRFYSTLRRISTEQKKSNSNLIKAPSEAASIITTSSSLLELLTYFPQALEEKKRLYQQYKESVPNYSSLSPISIEIEDKDEEKLLNKKTNRPFKAPFSTTNINNNFNVNVSINSSLIEGLQPNKKKENIEDLENAIEKWCSDRFNAKDKSFEILEMKINKLLEKESNVSNCPSNIYSNGGMSNYNTVKNVDIEKNNNCEAINSLLTQLNELEKILQVTKQDLYATYDKNSNVNNNMNNFQNTSNANDLNNYNSGSMMNFNSSTQFSSTPYITDFNSCQSKNILNNLILPINVSNNPYVSPNLNRSLQFEEICADESNAYLFDYMFKF